MVNLVWLALVVPPLVHIREANDEINTQSIIPGSLFIILSIFDTTLKKIKKIIKKSDRILIRNLKMKMSNVYMCLILKPNDLGIY